MNTGKNGKSVLAYVPVIHRGYLDFFDKHEGDIKIFGEEVIAEYVHLTRDIRAVTPPEAVRALSALLPDRNISVAEIPELKAWDYTETVMPDDEVCRDLAEKYLKKTEVSFVPVFLRWNRMISTKESEISPGRKISDDIFHKEVMSVAFKESEMSADWWRQVGAAVVKDGKITFLSHNRHLPSNYHLMAYGDPRSNFDAGQSIEVATSMHAEAEIIARAAEKGESLSGSSIYVTTFPCPNCARLICMSGIKKVYYSKGYSLLDAEKIFDHFGVEVVLVK